MIPLRIEGDVVQQKRYQCRPREAVPDHRWNGPLGNGRPAGGSRMARHAESATQNRAGLFRKGIARMKAVEWSTTASTMRALGKRGFNPLGVDTQWRIGLE